MASSLYGFFWVSNAALGRAIGGGRTAGICSSRPLLCCSLYMEEKRVCFLLGRKGVLQKKTFFEFFLLSLLSLSLRTSTLLQIGTRKIEREFGRMAWKSVF
jgi:hypothetical protein